MESDPESDVASESCSDSDDSCPPRSNRQSSSSGSEDYSDSDYSDEGSWEEEDEGGESSDGVIEWKMLEEEDFARILRMHAKGVDDPEARQVLESVVAHNLGCMEECIKPAHRIGADVWEHIASVKCHPDVALADTYHVIAERINPVGQHDHVHMRCSPMSSAALVIAALSMATFACPAAELYKKYTPSELSDKFEATVTRLAEVVGDIQTATET